MKTFDKTTLPDLRSSIENHFKLIESKESIRFEVGGMTFTPEGDNVTFKVEVFLTSDSGHKIIPAEQLYALESILKLDKDAIKGFRFYDKTRKDTWYITGYNGRKNKSILIETETTRKKASAEPRWVYHCLNMPAPINL